MNPKDQVKDNLSIVDVVSTYIRLEKSGNQFRARCPFHSERTPSFYVSLERKSYHCFGCQAHGDIFSFVEKIENIPFFEALKILADRAGVSLKDSNRNKEEGRLIALLSDATSHFEDNLNKSPESKSYLMERGLTEDTIKTFHIGFAKNEWRDLFVFLSSKGYSPEEIEKSGLAIKAVKEDGTTKGWYDRFRGRIMFPIRNVSGRTVGYSGRILPVYVDETVAQGKYVNTPETELYHKSKILFGYDTAKKVMSDTKEVVVVEGQMDLCMSYQSGIHNVVAVSGTAFTDEHINLIKRFCNKVILSFDTDSAGQNALMKSAIMCLMAQIDVYVVGDIGRKDPADLIKEDPNLWIKAVKENIHIIEFILNKIIKEEKDERNRGKRIVDELLNYVRAVSSPVDRAFFVRKISEKSKIGENILMEEILKRGHLQNDYENKKEEEVKINPKENLEKEIIALSVLMKKEKDVLDPLSLDIGFYPEEIINKEVFNIEKKDIKDKEKYLKEIISSYKKIIHKEKLLSLQAKLKDDNVDHENVMKEIMDHVKNSH